jgi:hypothetical protein
MSNKLRELQQKHNSFFYKSYSYKIEESYLKVKYEFLLSPNVDFQPEIDIPLIGDLAINIDRLVFLLGMVELISYWKVACPEEIIIECEGLSDYENAWWEKLFRNGLGEFFYQNNISPSIPFRIISSSERDFEDYLNNDLKNKATISEPSFLVLVGGGKDSIVSLELIKKYAESKGLNYGALCLNPISASLEAVNLARYEKNLIIKRRIDPQLIKLNKDGYLNGHTPFSALLSFSSVLTALLNGFTNVVSSNESSASFGNVNFEDYEINHQYSKSIYYENDFRSYMEHLNCPVNYFSLLRPLNEIQIASFFSGFEKYHSVFRSCNVGQTALARADSISTKWCGTCPKCVFTFICLSAFLSLDKLEQIFGDNILLKDENLPHIRDLLGKGELKPFECVGTKEEVSAALCVFLKDKDSNLLYDSIRSMLSNNESDIKELLIEWNIDNSLPPTLIEFIKIELDSRLNKYEF